MINKKPNLINQKLLLELNCKPKNNFVIPNFIKILKDFKNIILPIIFILFICFILYLYKNNKQNKNKEMEILYKELKNFKKQRKKAEQSRLEQNIKLQEKPTPDIIGFNDSTFNTY